MPVQTIVAHPSKPKIWRRGLYGRQFRAQTQKGSRQEDSDKSLLLALVHRQPRIAVMSLSRIVQIPGKAAIPEALIPLEPPKGGDRARRIDRPNRNRSANRVAMNPLANPTVAAIARHQVVALPQSSFSKVRDPSETRPRGENAIQRPPHNRARVTG